jgi:hypothetical protein
VQGEGAGADLGLVWVTVSQHRLTGLAITSVDALDVPAAAKAVLDQRQWPICLTAS